MGGARIAKRRAAERRRRREIGRADERQPQSARVDRNIFCENDRDRRHVGPWQRR